MKRSRPLGEPGTQAYLVHEEEAPRGAVLWVVLALALAPTLVLGVVFLRFYVGGAAIMFGLTVLFAIMFYLVIPRRYQVYNTKLRIVLGWPLGWDIPLSTIREAQPADAFDAWAYAGVRLATSSRTPVEIVRRRGWNVIISPSDREVFLNRLNEAMNAARGSQT